MKQLLLTFSLVGLLTGCGDSKDAAPEPITPSPPPQGNADITPAATALPTAPPPAGAAQAAISPSAPSGPAESAPIDAAAKERILAAMQSYVIDNSGNPKSLDDLVTRGYLKSLPAAPDGKKWVYNSEKLAIELADK